MNEIWEYYTTPEIVFGSGSIKRISEKIEKLQAKKIVIITDSTMSEIGLLDKLTNNINKNNIEELIIFDQAVPEPTVGSVMNCVDYITKNINKVDVIITLGGGSCIDLAKSTSLILTHGGIPSDYFGENLVPGPVIPLISIPTTSGTGSEMTSVAVITDTDNNLKVGISDNYLRSEIAILDPELTIGLPSYTTACSGMDALSHAIETYTATSYKNIDLPRGAIFQGALPISDLLSLEAIKLIVNNLKKAVNDGNNLEARSNMMMGSMLAGIAMSNSGTAAAHAAAYPIASLVKSPHGEITGLLLPYVMKFNALFNVEKMANIALLINPISKEKDKKELALLASEYILKLVKDINLPTKLSEIGIKKEDVSIITDTALSIQRIIRNNPRKANLEEFEKVLLSAF